MEQDIPVSIDLPRDLLLTLGRAAGQAGCAPTDYVYRLLSAALDPVTGQTDNALRMALRLALRLATDWPDLQHRLRMSGHVLRALNGAEGELSLCRWPLERPLMPLTALGVSRADLVLRLGADFPPDGDLCRARMAHATLNPHHRRVA